MDSGNDGGEKSLPGGMSFPKWMRRTTERYDYSEYCSSPPTDGFFQLPTKYHQRNPGTPNSETVECLKNQRRDQLASRQIETLAKPSFSKTICEMEKASGIYSSGGTAGTKIQLHLQGSSNKESSAAPEPLNIFKTVNATSSTKTESGTTALSSAKPTTSITAQSTISNAVKENPNICRKKSLSTDGLNEKFDNRAISKMNIPPPNVIVTRPDDGSNLLGLVESKFGNKDRSVPCTPDVTPSSTPQVTPSSSPQMGRRSGNPFFTPSSNAPGSVSWLFRPPQADGYSSDREGDSSRDNILYETKVKVNPATQQVQKSFVPRPSKLRELNFWSPTTM